MNDSGNIAALVLAAGDSRRMGSPKALLRIGDATFLERVVATARAASLDPVRVVAGRHAAAIAQSVPALSALVVVNPDPDLGQLHSLRIGLEALPGTPDAVVVFLVDHPLVRIETVQALVSGFRERRRPIVVPSFGGRRGHPVVFGREVFDELRGVPLEGGARAVVNADERRLSVVGVDDPGILVDVDTPEEYRGARDRDGAR